MYLHPKKGPTGMNRFPSNSSLILIYVVIKPTKTYPYRAYRYRGNQEEDKLIPKVPADQAQKAKTGVTYRSHDDCDD